MHLPFLNLRRIEQVLDSLCVTPYFSLTLTSEEEGIEKPDPRIFKLACERLSSSLISRDKNELKPEEVLHVGDELRWWVFYNNPALKQTQLIDGCCVL